MEVYDILSMVDHTLLRPDATWEQIKTLCDEGIKYRTASVCIPASYVAAAKNYVDGKIKICTVIGFPCGYSVKEVKCFEASCAVRDGADEIDMVINIGWLKDGQHDKILDEIKAVKEACDGRVLKVITETCLLSDEEKIKMCEIVSASGADFIKTSTGFSSGGATAHDIALFAQNIDDKVKIKAAGGISSLEDAEEFIRLGAERLGTSRMVGIAKEYYEMLKRKEMNSYDTTVSDPSYQSDAGGLCEDGSDARRPSAFKIYCRKLFRRRRSRQ